MVAGAVATAVDAQTPLKQNLAVVGKITANWCPPCGGWGWTLNDDVLTAGGANTTGLGIYSSTRTDGSNNKFQNQAAYDLAAFITLGGYPSFSVNMKDISDQNTNPDNTINTAGIKTDAAADIAAFAAAPVVASTGMTYRISGNTVTVKTKTKFWEAASGTYNVAVYLVEDGALAPQAGKTGAVEHHNVLRTSMTASTWGEQIATGTIAKDAEFTKDFTFDLSGSITPAHADQPSTWDKTKLVPFAVIYKINGSTSRDYVNGARHYEFPATIEATEAVNNMAVYPNPAYGSTSVSFDQANSANITINMIDNLGRTVYTSGVINANAGRTIHTINTANLAAGIYNINIVSDNGISTQRVSVVK